MTRLFIALLMVWTGNALAAPSISMSSNVWAVLPHSTTCAALSTNSDGLPITNVWSQISGPGVATFASSTAAVTTVTFASAGTYLLRMASSDHTGTNYADCTASVYASPYNLHVMFSGTGGGTINGQSSNYTARYTSSTALTLTATAVSGSMFVGWVGSAYTGTNNSCTVTVDSTKDITGIFDLQAVATNLYYVATNGSDAASGRAGFPWLTLGHAVATITNGSKLVVGPGEYNEFVTIGTSGTPTMPIVFEGTRDASGQWLTVIDPSTPLTSGWVSAPEFATNTYKYTGLTHEPKEMEIDHKRVCFTFTNGYIGSYLGSTVLFVYTNDAGVAVSQASNMFNMPANALVLGYGNPMRFWDGLEALYCTSGGAAPYTCYLRFRNGDDPNGKDIRVAPNYDGLVIAPGAGGSLTYPAINFDSRSNVTFRNFIVRGAFGSANIANLANNIVLENNRLIGGYTKTFIGKAGGSGTTPNGNTVRNNEIRSDYYGFSDCGAWNMAGAPPPDYRFSLRKVAYGNSKYTMGWGDTWDESVTLIQSGDTNRVYGNHIYNGFGGDAFYIDNTAAPAANGTLIWDNIIENQSSVGILINRGQTNLMIFDNAILDCDINVRFGVVGIAGETTRYSYLFRNTSWLPNQVGQHFFFHGDNSSPSAYFPTMWVYNNSFSGGQSVFDWNGNFPANGGTPNLHIVNNILSGTPFYFNTSSMGTISATNVGDFAYNELLTATHPIWYGTNNIDVAGVEWANTPNITFALTNGSVAISAAIDVSQPFTLQNITHAALPQDGTLKVGPAWDIGALEYQLPPPTAAIGTATFY